MKRYGVIFSFVASLCTPAVAQDITLVVSSENDGLERTLERESLTIETLESEDSKPQDLVAAARADYRRMLTALYAKGYYGGTVSIRIDGREASGLEPLFAPSSIQKIDIDVDPGPRFAFGSVTIAPLPEGATLPADLAPGAPAEADLIRSGVRSGINAWRDLGYAKATAGNQSIVANHADRQLDVSVQLSPGPRLSFGALEISGNEAVRTSAVRRIAGLPEGEVYSPAELEKAARRLRATGAFDGVALTEADDIGPNDTLGIAAQIREAKPRRFGFGVEFSSVEGLQLSSFWMHRNAFGGAERFRVDGEISGIGGETGGIDYTLGTSLSIPAVRHPDNTLLLQAELSREDEPEYLLDQLSIGANLTRVVNEEFTTDFGFGLIRAREETDLTTRDYTLFTVPMGAELDRRDDEKDTKDGYYIDADLTPFIGLQGGANGGRIAVDARAFRSVGETDRLTFAARMQLGSVLGATTADAPADFLFYSGGGGTVRGQSYNSLGVTDAGVTTGGTSFLGTQIEARYAVTDKIGIVGFWDYGHIGDTAQPGTSGAWHSGTGLGVRYQTGIGPIRLDVGVPANGDNAFGSVQVYLGIGQAF